MQTTQTDALPWYREPWPWLLMAGPVAVIIAGFATVWLAVISSDGLVVDDYYKQGLAINQTLQRDALAMRRAYRAELQLDAGGRKAVLTLVSADSGKLPELLKLRIVHPTQAGHDRLLLLRRSAAGDYVGAGNPPSAGRWLLVLEDVEGSWRLTGSVMLPSAGTVILDSAATRLGG